LGYISKGIALCGNDHLCDAMEAFDLSFVFLNHDPIAINLVLLIKAVALFNANCHDEAMRRLNDLAIADQHSHTRSRSIVNLYIRALLALAAFDDGRYSEAADLLNDSILSIADWFSRRTSFEPELKLFTVLFGWDLDSLWQTVNQRRCDVFLLTDRIIEAVESHQYMMRMIDENVKGRYLEWSTAFKKRCTVRCVKKGHEAIDGKNYETAIGLYSAALVLDPSHESFLVFRSKAYVEQNLYAKALEDAEKVIELDPSSYLGYEVKHGVLHRAERYDEAIDVFKIMLSKLDDAHDRELRQQYVSQVNHAIQEAIDAKLENSPLRLLNTLTGHVNNREAQINAFMNTAEYKKILSSSMTCAPPQTESIKEEVGKYFSWAMLSHRWGGKEPLLHDVQVKGVYNLDPVGETMKLQKFCEVARDAGYLWAWSDTCCIDQNNNVEVTRSVNSMFVWYRYSALTIVHLSDVPSSSKPGALADCTWNTRGWTVQEFLAPKIIRFYTRDWTPYLDDRCPNHKESTTIMQELAYSTRINIRSLITFEPGMTGAREKLQWSSSRVTTLPEDIAYSLFGIFGTHLSVIYGENKRNALGRLLQEIIARSGDITALDWVGKSSDFNSCLPADITSYKAPPSTPLLLSEDEMQTSISALRDTVDADSASKLYTLIDNLSPPRFANSRLQLPCIAFLLTEVRLKSDQDKGTCSIYNVKADGLRDLQITTDDKLTQFSPARPARQTFFLIRPWNRDDLEPHDFADESQDVDDWPEPSSPSGDPPGGPAGDHEVANSESDRALRLMVHLGQPFGALLLAQQRGGVYKRIASDRNITAQVKDPRVVDNMMNVRTLEIL
jgi:tetratricopeptide (TPR) repeat protein